MKNKVKLDDDYTLVAQWETKGNDWIVLYKHQVPRLGDRIGPFTVYGYRAGTGLRSTGGGGIAHPDGYTRTDMDDAMAIREMERPWNGDGRPGAGAAFVLQSDRPSLKRVFPETR